MIVTCTACGVDFNKKPCLVGIRNFCCLACKAVGHTTAGRWSATPDVEARRAYFRDYRTRTIEQRKEMESKWRKENRPSRNATQQKRRAAGYISVAERAALVAQAGACRCCGSTDELQIDHVQPLCLGGKNERDNIQILCRICNQLKRNRVIPLDQLRVERRART